MDSAPSKNLRRSVEEFLQLASHDLRSPIRNVQSFAELLREDEGLLDPEARRSLDFILAESERAAQSLAGLMELFEIEVENWSLETVDCDRLLVSVLEDLDDELPVGEGSVIATALPRVRAHEPRLRQIFTEILRNAARFRTEELLQIMIRGATEKNDAVLSFTDNGIGIERKSCERVLQPFRHLYPRGHYPGRGLGLAFCRRIARRLGGEITLRSEGAGRGTTVRLRLPRADDEVMYRQAGELRRSRGAAAASV